MRILKINAFTLARNTFYNLTGQVIAACAAILFLPAILRGLGEEGYGIISLATMMFGAFGLFELGLGRATTKYVAEHLAKDQASSLAQTVWTSVFIQLLTGIIGGVILALLSPLIVSVLKLSPSLRHEANRSLLILAASMPVVLGTSSLRGALEGAQRFDLVNIVKAILNVSTYVIPLAGVYLKLSLSNIIFVMLISRLVAAIAYLLSCLYSLPQLKKAFSFKRSHVRTLFSYAGWIALSNVIVPCLTQIDRYMIAALVAVSAVSHFSIPYEMMNGFWIIPGALTAVLFPAFASLDARSPKTLQDLYWRPVKYLVLVMGPILSLAAVYSHEILSIWQGSLFASKSSTIFQVLVIGVFVNSLGWIPSSYLMGTGRPDLVTKIQAIQLPLYVMASYLIISRFGVLGAAVAFSLRVTVESGLLFWNVGRLMDKTARIFLGMSIAGSLLSVIVFAASSLLVRNAGINSIGQYLILIGLFLGFAALSWFYNLDDTDKALAKSISGTLFGKIGPMIR